MGQYSGYSGVPKSSGTAAGDLSASPSASLWHQVDADGERHGIWRDYWNGFDGSHGADQAALPTTVAAYYGGLVFTDTGGTFTPTGTAGENGDIKVSSDGTNEGANWSQGVQPFSFFRHANNELVFECRLKTSTIANDKHGIFVGLMESHTQSATVPIAAAGTMADANFVGFWRLEGDGDYVDTTYKANGVTQVIVKSDAHILVADEYIKLGMRFNHGGDYKLRFFVNGAELADTKTVPDEDPEDGTDFPNDVQLGCVYAMLNATSSTPGDTHLSWIRCAQKRNW